MQPFVIQARVRAILVPLLAHFQAPQNSPKLMNMVIALQWAIQLRGPKKGFPFKVSKKCKKCFWQFGACPLKNVKKMSQNAFWGLLAASQKNVQKMSGKCPGAGVGAGKMSRKCQKNVPQTFSRHFFDIFWQLENQKGARARSARAPFWVAAEGRHLSICQKVSKKCLENVWGTLF